MASAASGRRKQPLPLPKHCRRHSPAADEAVDVKDERVEVQLRRRHSTRSPTQPDRRRRRQKVDANPADQSPSQIPVPSSPAEEDETTEEVTKEEAAELPAQQSSHSWLPQPLPLAAALVPPPPWHRHSQPGRSVFACVYLCTRDACNVCLSCNLRAGNRMKDEGTEEEVAKLPAQQASHSWLSPATALVPPPPRHRYSQPGQRLACMCGFAYRCDARVP